MKNIYKIARNGALALGALALMVGCQDETIYNYLEISDRTVSFEDSANDEIKIEVEASGEWTYTVNDSWIEEVSSDNSGIVITVSDNTSSSMRYGTITFTCDDMESKATVLQASVGSNAQVVLNDAFNGGVVSPSGRYIAGRVIVGGGDVVEQVCPVLIDAKSGDMTVHESMIKETDIGAVDDFGNIFTSSGIVSNEGVVSAYDLPNECSWAEVLAVSLDGSVWVGRCFPKSKKLWEEAGHNPAGTYGAIKWVDGVPEILEVPETNGTGEESLWYGLQAFGCSDDGSIIYGNVLDYFEACYWDKDGHVKLIAPELNEFSFVQYTEGGEKCYTLESGTQQNFEYEKISPNGKYLAFQYDNGGGLCPAYLNTETGEYKVLKEYSGLATNTMDNDGNMFVCPSTNYGPASVITPDGEKIDGNDWVKDNYGLIISDARAICQVAADGSLFGYKSLDTQYYLAWWLLR